MHQRHGVSPDPVEYLLAQETAVDHLHAKFRGERALRVANAAISRLQAEGITSIDPDILRPILFQAVADEWYGRAAVDVPPLRSEP